MARKHHWLQAIIGMERRELMAWADAVVRNTESHAADNVSVMSDRDREAHAAHFAIQTGLTWFAHCHWPFFWGKDVDRANRVCAHCGGQP